MKKKRRKARERHEAPFERLRVMADYGSSGIWVVKRVGIFRHGMADYSDLKLSSELAERFTRWIELYEKQIDAPSEYDYRAFNEEGRQLAHALKLHVGTATHVEFQAETSEGGLSHSEEII